MNKELIFDLEADGLLDELTKIHCLSYTNLDGSFKGTVTSDKDISELFSMDFLFIGHHIIGYDLKVLKKLLGVDTKQLKVLDTYGFSLYLYPDRTSHGLESWGVDLGVAKPEIKDWKTLSQKEYEHRCETDVEINKRLYKKIKDRIKEIYND